MELSTHCFNASLKALLWLSCQPLGLGLPLSVSSPQSYLLPLPSPLRGSIGSRHLSHWMIDTDDQVWHQRTSIVTLKVCARKEEGTWLEKAEVQLRDENIEGSHTERIADSPTPHSYPHPPLVDTSCHEACPAPRNTFPSTLALANLPFTDNLTHWAVLSGNK